MGFGSVVPGLCADVLSLDRGPYLDLGLSPCLYLCLGLYPDPCGWARSGDVDCDCGHAVVDREGFHLGTQEDNKAGVPRRVLGKMEWEEDRGKRAEEGWEVMRDV